VTSPGPALRCLLEVLEKLGISCFAGGSLASSVHGIPRATRDVDLVADLGPEHVDALVRELGSEFYADRGMILDALERARPFNLIHFASAYKFDIFPMRGDEFAEEEFGRREIRQVPLLDESFSLPVASAEDIVLSKLRWFRRGGEISERQWADARGVVEAQRDRLDINYLRRWAKSLPSKTCWTGCWRRPEFPINSQTKTKAV